MIQVTSNSHHKHNNNPSSSQKIQQSQQKSNTQSQSKSIRHSSSSQAENAFVALHKLKQTEEHLQMMKRRLSVLKVKQDKNNLRYLTNMKKMSLHNSVQELSQIDKDRISQWKEQNQIKIEEYKYSNLTEKVAHHKKMEKLKEKLKIQKQTQFTKSKEISKVNEEKIQALMSEHLENKQNINKKIKQMEKNAKKQIQAFNMHKKIELKEKKYKQADKLHYEKLKKQEQIRMVAEMEMEMIERQSRSRMICENSQISLKKMLNPQVKTSRNSTFRYKQKSSQKDILSQRKCLDTSLSGTTTEKQRQSSNIQTSLPQINSARKYTQVNNSKGYFLINL